MRIACLKGLPNDHEISEAGFEDAGAYMRWLKDKDEEHYDKLIDEGATPWPGLEPPQPVARCVDHVCTIMFRAVHSETKVDNGPLQPVGKNLARKWWEKVGALG